MTTEEITAWTQLVVSAVSGIVAISGAFISLLRYRLRMAMLAKGLPPDKLPDIAGPGPVVLVLLAGGMLAYLCAQNPRLAQLLPNVLGAESSTASAAPVGRDLCNKDGDCGSGCRCDKNRCACSGFEKKQSAPRERKPPAVSMAGTVCADCLALPWMQVAIQTAPGRPE